MTWQERAACRDADPAAFIPDFGPSDRTARTARFVCLSQCGVTDRCRTFGDSLQATGLFGGVYREHTSDDYVTTDYRVHPPLIAFSPHPDSLLSRKGLAERFGYDDPDAVRKKLIRAGISPDSTDDTGANLYSLRRVRSILERDSR